MAALLFVSILWAFSFGLIKGRLAGLDPNLVAFLRLLLAFAVFLPWLRPRGLGRSISLRLVLLGALQFGVMYVAVMRSYQYLPAYQVAVLTIFTPLWVAAFEDLLRRRPTPRNYVGALLAVAGAGLIVARADGESVQWHGVLLVQVSNLAFAAGQVLYRRIPLDRPQHRIFALPYLGGVVVAGAAAAWTADSLRMTATQAATILYLGVVASGLGFFLWNVGARRVSVAALAVWNNGYIPLAVIFSLVLFGEQADLPRLVAGSLVIGAGLWWSRRPGPPAAIDPGRGAGAGSP